MKPLKVIYYIALSAIALLAVLLIFSTFPIPGNYKLYVVQSGSMQPVIKMGSVVFVKPVENYQKDDIITFADSKNPKNPITHRIVEIKKEGETTSFVTKGDSNNASDTKEVAIGDVIGKVLFSLPFIGYGVAATRQPIGFMLLIILPATLIIYDEIRKIKDQVVKMRSKKTLLLLFAFSVTLMTFNFTKAYLSDTETSTGNTFQVTTWDVWKQTDKDHFEAGTLSDVDTTTSAGDMMLAGAYPVVGDTVALWHLNEGADTTAYDETGNDNDGTLNGDTNWLVGKYSQGLEFDGDGDYVNVVDSASLDITGSITVEAWVKADTWNNLGASYNVRNIIDKGEHKTSKAYSVYSYNNKLHFRINKNSSCDVSCDLPAIDEWHHLAATYDGSTMKLYIDNDEKESISCTATIQTNNESLYIGGAVDRNYWFDGQIDEVRISNTAKTSFPIDYFSSGTLESQVFDGGGVRDWDYLEWDETLTGNSGDNDITFEVVTSTNGTDWSAWSAPLSDSPIDLTGLSDTQYIKWKANLTTTDSSLTPVLYEVRIRHFAP